MPVLCSLRIFDGGNYKRAAPLALRKLRRGETFIESISKGIKLQRSDMEAA
jgi:hypothetical protein